MSSGHAGKYEVMVAAESREEAIAVAAEGLPRGAELTTSDALETIPGTWAVKLAFRGGKRASSDLID